MNEERFEALVTAVERLRDQVQRLVADAESEKDTRARANAEFAKLIKELRDETMKMVKDLRDETMNIFYGHDRKSGLVVDSDRMNNDMTAIKKLGWWLIGAVTTIAIFLIRDLIISSN